MNDPLLVHLHIPHTGGTSIHHLIRTALEGGTYDPSVDRDPAGYLATVPEACRAITGHFKHLIGPETWSRPYLSAPRSRRLRLVTTLRHPVDRAISRVTQGHADAPPNLQTAYILDETPSSSWDARVGQVAHERLRARFWWVGLTHTLDLAWASLAAALGILDAPGPFRLNPSTRAGRVDREAVLAENRADLELYERLCLDRADLGLFLGREVLP